MVRPSLARQPLSFAAFSRPSSLGHGGHRTAGCAHGCHHRRVSHLLALGRAYNFVTKSSSCVFESCRKLVYWRCSGPPLRSSRLGGTVDGYRTYRVTPGTLDDAQAEAERQAPSGQEYALTTEEVRSLVDLYSCESLEPVQEDPASREQLDGHVATQEEQTDGLPPHADKNTLEVVQELRLLLRDEDQSQERLYSVYYKLPTPRAAYLPQYLMDQVLDHFCVVEHSSEPIMLRYLSVVDDVKAAGRRIQLRHWNSMIRLVAKCFKKISDHKVNAAMDIWRQMERDAGVQPDHVTFNILFDIATKAGKFPLADMLHREMQARGLRYTRYFRTSMIYHCGLRRDSDAVRKGYLEFVEADEIVDTTVINSVIAALLLCGEATSAEMTFERMKRLNAAKTHQPLPPSNWRDKRKLGRSLQKEADRRRLLKRQQNANLDGPFSPNVESAQVDGTGGDNQDDAFEGLDAEGVAIEDQTSVAPDLTTFKLLIHYHAVVAADIDRVADLIDEMEHYDIAVHGSIFLYLLKAFRGHGGILYTQWTATRLRQTWASYLDALDADGGAGNVYISPSMCMLAARAFLTCANPYEAAKAWYHLKIRISTISSSQVDELEQDIAHYMQNQADHFWRALDYLTRRSSANGDDIAKVELREDEDEGLIMDDIDDGEARVAKH